MLEMMQDTFFPISSAVFIREEASALEPSRVFINAPLPVFTSMTIESAPSAIFLLSMLAVMREVFWMIMATS